MSQEETEALENKSKKINLLIKASSMYPAQPVLHMSCQTMNLSQDCQVCLVCHPTLTFGINFCPASYEMF